MAQTKTSQRKRKSKAGAKAKSKARAPSKPKASANGKAKSNGQAKSPGSTSRPKKAASKPAASKPQAVLETVEETARDAGGKVAGAVSKAKVPLLAGGAALAGAAGGLALGTRQAHHKGRVHVSSEDLAKAARKVGDVGAQVGEVALEVRRARQATNGNGSHRSPIEVVLQGLTQRRPPRD